MNGVDLLILNFEEVRRRSIKIWNAIPTERLRWKPDSNALSFIEMIEHVLAAEYFYLQIIQNRGSIPDPIRPYKDMDFSNVKELLAFSEPYREQFIVYIRSLTAEELFEIKIDRTDLYQLGHTGYVRSLGDMLLRYGYHEAVHAGQILDYMRTINIPRPDIWD
ncbi:DinB family protein [Fictibacillus sp. BK138]|uniref:DinB family protein n=1 Tax=Fictibacillus sp. BK138 TaxID=2512121 RepID=UPI00102A03EC|nr:DinB family protein [Fictibacillus sp. BK138]RZT15529.1 putative damage-inducible protein DinB [Fictibacillus sp. BK138]